MMMIRRLGFLDGCCFFFCLCLSLRYLFLVFVVCTFVEIQYVLIKGNGVFCVRLSTGSNFFSDKTV